ncbi:hypothetical protein [Roseomonas indoligenes]|uniref:Uncharacterized protein n=1 Tax=Roseomonas indoligenes TaxID=2820811 RepID=A0A940S3V9_9PROT|nr:hypothetical protein [Pararoseomonas indoligenes]MBP0492656.1 hypothetical protein [Pararoseomonas indoligenes]
MPNGFLPRLRAVLLAFLLAAEPTAPWSHAALLGTGRENGATVATAPQEMTPRFDGAVTLIGPRVAGPAGEVATRSGRRLRRASPPDPDLVSWRVIPAD